MKRPPRPVIVAVITGRTVALRPALNGAGLTSPEVRDLARIAVGDVQHTARATFVGLSQLPDLEALAETRGIVVQRTYRGRATA